MLALTAVAVRLLLSYLIYAIRELRRQLTEYSALRQNVEHLNEEDRRQMRARWN